MRPAFQLRSANWVSGREGRASVCLLDSFVGRMIGPQFNLGNRPSKLRTQATSLLEFLDTNVAVPDTFRFILKTDVALWRTVLYRRLIQFHVLDLLSIEFNLQ